MVRHFSTLLTGLLVVLISTVSVTAKDVAFLIGNRDYQNASTMFDAEQIMEATTKLRNAGYTVVAGQDLSIDQTRGVLRGFAENLKGAERVIIVLTGHFVNSGNDTWFVPVNATPPNPISINYEGLSLQTILDYAGRRPGGAAVFLGTSPRPIAVTEGLNVGLGDLDIPQGVLVVTGKPADISKTLERNFLKRGASFASALQSAGDSVSGSGYISEFGTLAKKAKTAPPPISKDGSNDDGYWQAVNDMGGEGPMRAYLRAFPTGKHAAEAQKFLDELVVVTPVDAAKAAEAALSLSREQRGKIQEHLSLLGYDTRGIDGIFGRGSRGAIGDWQADRGFGQTGYLTQRQINKLRKQAEKKADELSGEANRQRLALEAADHAYWQSSGAADGKTKGYRRYLKEYPDGLHADEAQAKLKAIEDAKKDKAEIKEQKSWNSASSINSIASYQAYLGQYASGIYADEAKSRIAKLEGEAARADLIAAAEKDEAALRLNSVSRVLVEKQLVLLGFDPGSVDGVFEKRTRRAIRRFQKARGFPVTGYLNRQTFIRLIAESGG